MLLSAVSVFVVVQPSSEVPEGLMNCPVYNFVSCRAVSNVSSKWELLKMLIVAYWTVAVTVVKEVVAAVYSLHEPVH
jgi:hypothetical protein